MTGAVSDKANPSSSPGLSERMGAVEPLKDIRRLVRHSPITLPADLVFMVLRAWLGDAASVLSAGHTPRQRRRMGTMERHFRGFLRSNFHRLRIALPKIPTEEPVVMGNRHRGAAAGSNTLRSFGDSSVDRRGGDGSHGRHCDGRLHRPDHSILPSGPARHDAYDIRRSYRDRFSIWDVLGTFLYQEYGGFTVCVVAIMVVYALILPTLLLIPKDLIVTADGQKLQILDQTKGAAAN